MEQSALYATMSGTNLMVVTTVLLETGLLTQTEPVTTLVIEVPAGLIDVHARCERGRVTLVEFDNVPSFATAVDVPVEIVGFGTVPVSVAWGGMACAVVDADALGLELAPDHARALGEAMIAVCGAAREQIGFRHPLNDELAEIEAAVVIGRPHDPRNHARQTCGIPTGQMDTSPSGTGTSAGMAVLHARGSLSVGEEFRTEGVLGGVFRCSITRETDDRRDDRDRPSDRWTSLDHRACEIRAPGRRSVPGRVRARGHLARREHRFRRGAPRRGPEARTGLTVVLRYFPSAAMKPIAAKPAPIPIRSQAAKSPSRMPSPTPMQIPPTNAGPP